MRNKRDRNIREKAKTKACSRKNRNGEIGDTKIFIKSKTKIFIKTSEEKIKC